ncbi:josephin-2 isoform X1 [Camelus bactrianus]|uniref:Josephin-2 n=1 Tax=Camelus bactrianus TaxID=9837 RepID=A0A9W3FU21_CAMBA
MVRPGWRPREESAMSPVSREARETDPQKKNTQLSPRPPLPLPCPPRAQRQNKGALVQTRLAPDSRLNPHRSLLGTGNYDVNVIMAALQGQGLAAVWWDRRRPLSQLALPQVLGLILNLPSPVSLGLLSLPLRRRHWVALRQVDGIYYNLDSKLRAPEILGDEDGVRAFLAAEMAQGLCEVLLVVTKEVEEKGSWLRTD